MTERHPHGAGDRNLQVLAWRVGVDGTRRTQADIAGAFGVSRERIRQVEAEARAACRRLASSSLRAELEAVYTQQIQSLSKWREAEDRVMIGWFERL